MKKIIAAALLSAVGLFMSGNIFAQSGFGIIAGMNFNTAKIKDVQLESKTGWSIGGTYLLDLPFGLSLQPSLVYSQKSADAVVGTQTVGSVNLPVSIQWGPDLIIVRPFLDVTPYIGYSLFNKVEGKLVNSEGKNAFDYGVGVGAGLNVWKLQAIVRYNWNFGVLGSLSDFKDIDTSVLKAEDKTYGGVTFTLAYIF